MTFTQRSIFALVFAILSCIPTHSFAQGVGVRLQPTLIEEKVNPGDVFTEKLSITNITDQDITYYLVKRDIKGISPEGFPLFFIEGEELTQYEIAQWISLSQEPITVNAGETKQVEFTITVPQDATPGSHFGSVFLSLRPPKLRESGTGVGYEVGSIISLKISGDIVEDARIREFTTDKGIYSSPKVTFSTEVENLGNVLVRPRGPLEIVNIFGDKIAVVRLNDNNGAVLPKDQRIFTTTWEGERFSFGRYQAIVSLVYGDEGRQTITSTLSFWILPLNIILPVFGGIFAILLILYVGIQLHVRKKLRDLGVSEISKEQASRVTGVSSTQSKLTTIAIAVASFTILFFIILLILFA